MHSYIISGGTSAERETKAESFTKEWHIHPYDVIRIENEDSSIGIAQIRTFIAALQLKPSQSSLHAGIIPQGELLTPAAQQALLKTLEEPPQSVRIIISVPNSSHLLPTIVSRCQVISLTTKSIYSEKELEAAREIIANIQKASIGERLALCANLGKTKEELSAFLSCSIAAIRENLLRNNQANQTDTSLLHNLLSAKKYEGTNINLQLYIEHIFIERNDINIM